MPAAIKIPPDLLELLGEPTHHFGVSNLWRLSALTAALGCSEAAIRRWILEARIPRPAQLGSYFYCDQEWIGHLAANGVRGKCHYRNYPFRLTVKSKPGFVVHLGPVPEADKAPAQS